MTVLSLNKPQNEPTFNYASCDKSWEKFCQSVKNVPVGADVPLVIGGEKVYADKKRDSVSPSTLKKVATIQQADPKIANRAIEAALNAKPDWAALSPFTRIQKLRDLEVILREWEHDICATAAVECGYNAVEVQAGWAELMDFIRFNNFYYQELANKQMGDGIDETNQTLLRPLKGFTCAVSPFNFPIAIGFHLPLVMALTGNTVVWKPSEEATLTSYLLMLALEEAGFPPGVINFVTGDGRDFLQGVLTHKELTALNFTGSFKTARIFGNYLYSTQYERQNFPRFVAETGGKDFLVADKDIDIKDTANQIVAGAFGRSGQKCSANSVVYAHKNIAEALKKEVTAQASRLVAKNPLERDSVLGPVINEVAFNRLKEAIDLAKSDANCKVLAGGTYSSEKGYYIQPTVVEVNASAHTLLSTELFGPFTAMTTYESMEDLEKLLGQHNYRLTGAVISRSETFLEKAVPVLSQYAGNFYVNRKTTGAMVDQQPFGGDGASGTNGKAGSSVYLYNFISQGSVTRRHSRVTLGSPFQKF